MASSSSASSSSSSTLIHFLILFSIFLIPNFNFCSAHHHHNRRILALKNPSTPQFGSDGTSSSMPSSSEGDAILPTPPITFEEPTLLMPNPPVQQVQKPYPADNITPTFFPFPGFPSLPRFPPFPFIPTLPFGPGFDTIPADTTPPPPPPMTELNH